jgi:IS30 family transposase
MTASNRERRIRALRAQEIPQREIARQLGISPRTVGRIVSRLDQAFSSPSSPTAPAPGPSEQSVGSPLERTPELPTEDMQRHAETPDPCLVRHASSLRGRPWGRTHDQQRATEMQTHPRRSP